MAEEVAKQAKENGLFVEVAWASVGQKPNIAHVQACIAGMLGLTMLRDTASPEVRADLLGERLLQDDKKILVILDDIWEEIDLEDMGIPLGGANKNFKMLYTSRTRCLWHDPQTKEEILLEVGDLADARDLQPIAKQIVSECGRLSLAVVLIGRALSKKSGRNAIDIWKGVFDWLTCATSIPADECFVFMSRAELQIFRR